MMETVKNWALALAIAAVIVAVVEGLAPKGKLEGAIKLVCGIFLALVMVSPLTMLLGIDYSAGRDSAAKRLEASESIELEVRESVLRITRDNLRLRLEGVLERETGYAMLVRYIEMREEDGILTVEKVEIVTPEEAGAQAAAEAEAAICAELGGGVEVVIITQEGE